MKVSIVISAFNEERKIEDCLKSVVKIAEEIIFIDNTSTDKTVEIAKKYTDKIFTRENNKMLNVNKNFGFSKANNKWILNLDSDERVTPELAEEILSIDENTKVNGFFLPRKNILFGKWMQHSIWWPDYQLRLFKKEYGRFPEKHVHEYIDVIKPLEHLKNPIMHLNYETVSQYIHKLEYIYTESEVQNILSSGKKMSWYDALKMPVGDFLKTYFLQQGYKDGLHGLVLSLLQAFYMEVVFAKVWEKQGFEEKKISTRELNLEFQRLGKEISYWLLTIRMDENISTVKKIALKIKRRRFSHPNS